MKPSIKKTRKRCPNCNRKMQIVNGGQVKFYECTYCNYIEDVEICLNCGSYNKELCYCSKIKKVVPYEYYCKKYHT